MHNYSVLTVCLVYTNKNEEFHLFLFSSVVVNDYSSSRKILYLLYIRLIPVSSGVPHPSSVSNTEFLFYSQCSLYLVSSSDLIHGLHACLVIASRITWPPAIQAQVSHNIKTTPTFITVRRSYFESGMNTLAKHVPRNLS